MRRTKTALAAVILAVFGFTATSHAIIGIGGHYGLDYTLNMPDMSGDAAIFEGLKISVSSFSGVKGVVPQQFDTANVITGNDLPVFIDRDNWKNTGVNFGGKLYIDIIPLIDALEVSGNFGVWEYNSRIRYPSSLTWHDTAGGTRFMDYLTPQYDTTEISLDKAGLGYFGLKGTPYAKLNLDLTIRKYLVRFPKSLKVINLYGGAGLSCLFATPAMSGGLIEKAIGSDLNTTLQVNNLSAGLFDNQAIMKKVLEKIMSDLMTPHFGAHLDLGIMVKIPVIPVGVYVDGKFYIPFGKLDESVDVGGMGPLVNAGLALHF